jgi:transposase
MARYELSDAEWKIIAPLLPNKPRGVPRVDDRRVLNGIFWRLRSGAPWADIPERYGPYTTCYNRFVRWRAAGVWDLILKAVSQAYNGKIQMIDSSVVRVHQHAANGEKKVAEAVAWAVPAAGSRPRSTRSSMRKAYLSSSS